jgi:predicted cobalt transporter CbtA
MELGRALKSGALAGLAAGLLLGVLLFALQEPLIDKSICYEQGQLPGCAIEEGEVTRANQKIVLVAASPLVGMALGFFFALVFGAARPYLPGRSPRAKALLLSLISFVVYPLAPSLRLPPLSPGVANELPTEVRNLWYALIMLGAAGAIALGFILYHLAVRRDPSPRGHMKAGIASLILMVMVAAIPILLYPGSQFQGAVLEEEPGFLAQYQAVTLGSLAVFWFALGFLFSTLWARGETAAAPGSKPETT